MSPRRLRLPAVLILVSLCGACSAWRRDPGRLQRPVAQREPLELWIAGRSQVVHGVVVQGDSVRVVPRIRPPDCDSCARRLALARIDSVRTRDMAPGRTTGVLAVGLAAVLIYALARWDGGSP